MVSIWLQQILSCLLLQATNLDVLQRQEEQIQRTLLFALIPVVVAFAFFVFIFYRSKREAQFKQQEAELKRGIAEETLKALQAQMNPHFIFNCLNSIHHHMHTNHAHAGEYLVKFSSLIRHVLESSSLHVVPLADEIEANRSYMQLEQFRMNDSFQFSIEAESNIDPNKVHIPPMVIQPFIENSIWHGLNQRSTGGRVDIRFSIKDDTHIRCVIADNGTDGEKSQIDLSHTVKKTSMGMSLILDRLNTLNALHHSKAGYEMNYLEGRGRSVTITIPFED